MTRAHIEKLRTILTKLESLQRDMLRSPRHKHDFAIEDLERAKTSLLIALDRAEE